MAPEFEGRIVVATGFLIRRGSIETLQVGEGVTRRIGRMVLTVVLLLKCAVAWMLGGMLLEQLGLEPLNLPGRVVLVFALLVAVQALMEHLR